MADLSADELFAKVLADPEFQASAVKADRAAKKVRDRLQKKIEAFEEREIARHEAALKKLRDMRNDARRQALEAHEQVEREAYEAAVNRIKA